MYFDSFWVDSVPPEISKIANDELGETPEIKETSLEEFRKIVVEDEKDLKVMMDDFFLLRFLRMKKFEVKRAHQTLKNYCCFKAKNSGVMADITMTELDAILAMNLFIIMPKRLQNGCGVMYFSIGLIDLNVISLEKVNAAALAILDMFLCNENMQICGMTFIIDYSGINYQLLGHIAKPSFLIAACQAISNTWPCRIKALHNVNEPSAVRFLYNAISRPLLPKKLRERLAFHGHNYEGLQNVFPLECLPESLGGTVGIEEITYFRDEIKKSEDLLTKLNSYVYKGKEFPVVNNL